MIISAILLIISIFGLIGAFNLPLEIEEETSLINYHHEGRFDYRVYQTESYLFDDVLIEATPEPNETTETIDAIFSPKAAPKYPVEYTDRFDMSFLYTLVPQQGDPIPYTARAEVKAIVNRPGMNPEEILLDPAKNLEGNSQVDFSFDADLLSANATMKITVDVYTTMEDDTGPIFENFSQDLTIKSTGPLLEVEEALKSIKRASFGALEYTQSGEFVYTVHLKPGSPWGQIAIPSPQEPPPPSPTPPPPPPQQSDKVLGPGDIIFIKLLKRMDVIYYYKLKSDSPIREAATEVEITAIVKGGDLWSKTFPLLYSKENDDFTVNFTLDMEKYFNVLETIRSEVGASAGSNSLIIDVAVHTTAETDFGSIDETFTQTMSTTLGGGTLEWDNQLTKTQPGSIKETRIIPNTAKYLGLSVTGIRTLVLIAAGIFTICFLISVLLYIKLIRERFPILKEEAQRIKKKYGQRIVEATGQVPVEYDKAISLDSIEDLINVSDEVGKPIIHQAPDTSDDNHAYYVFDGEKWYQFLLSRILVFKRLRRR